LSDQQKVGSLGSYLAFAGIDKTMQAALYMISATTKYNQLAIPRGLATGPFIAYFCVEQMRILGACRMVNA